jgi:hypothetical protein
MTAPFIPFPTEFISEVLSPGAGWDVQVWPMWTSGAFALDLISRMIPGGGPVGLSFEVVMVQPNPAGNGSKADVIP